MTFCVSNERNKLIVYVALCKSLTKVWDFVIQQIHWFIFFGAAFVLAGLSPRHVDVRVFAGCKSMFSMLIRGQGALWEQDGLLDQWSVTEIHTHTHTKNIREQQKRGGEGSWAVFFVQVPVTTDELSHECSCPFFFYLASEFSLLLVHRLHQREKKNWKKSFLNHSKKTWPPHSNLSQHEAIQHVEGDDLASHSRLFSVLRIHLFVSLSDSLHRSLLLSTPLSLLTCLSSGPASVSLREAGLSSVACRLTP